MKIPFSYKEQLFVPVLTVSLVGHLAFIGLGSFFSPAPQYAVEQAPSSMEVVIVNERDVREEKKMKEEILSVQDSAMESPAIVKVRKKPLQEQPRKPLYVPPVKGAVTEVKPAYLKNPAPVYPEHARMRSWEGVVLLKVFVNTDGTVGQIKIDKSSGYHILDESAFKTVRTWQFSPARVGGLSFSSWIKIPVRFILAEEK